MSSFMRRCECGTLIRAVNPKALSVCPKCGITVGPKISESKIDQQELDITISPKVE